MEDYKLRDLLVSHTLGRSTVVELEHLKIKTRLTNEKFASVKGEKVSLSGSRVYYESMSESY